MREMSPAGTCFTIGVEADSQPISKPHVPKYWCYWNVLHHRVSLSSPNARPRPLHARMPASRLSPRWVGPSVHCQRPRLGSFISQAAFWSGFLDGARSPPVPAAWWVAAACLPWNLPPGHRGPGRPAAPVAKLTPPAATGGARTDTRSAAARGRPNQSCGHRSARDSPVQRPAALSLSRMPPKGGGVCWSGGAGAGGAARLPGCVLV